MLIIHYFSISLISAFLLFFVQPMAAKTALPVLGGAPFVWNSCMVFFQALLLAGYFYAHILDRTLPVKRQPLVHIPLLMLTLLAFPLSFSGLASIDPAQHPMVWLLSVLALSVGAPFFVLSSTSPLLQRWFSFSGHRLAHNPYFLYSASNLGSFIGLLAYPLIIEPFLTLPDQARLLRFGFILLLCLFAVAAFFLNRFSSATAMEEIISDAPPNAKRIAQWLVLAFVPSSLLYGVTTYLVTDIASVPLLWVIPLALYLLTFVLMFGNHPPSLTNWRVVHLIGAPTTALLALLPQAFPASTLLMHLLIFFAAAMICHGRLAQLKPAASRLTEFYLWLSLGGVLGGIFNTFVAPQLFNSIKEYPLILLLSLIVAAPSVTLPTLRYGMKVLAIWVIAVAVFWLIADHIDFLLPWLGSEKAARKMLLGALIIAGLALVVVAYLMHKNRAVYYLAAIAPLLIVTPPLYTHINGEAMAFIGRNIFGVSRIIWMESMQAWQFRHGTTNHGIQSTESDRRLIPGAYYGPPLKEIVHGLPKSLAMAPVGVMGMGVGTVACYGHPGQQYDFFEINPIVETIARDTRYFTYLKDCMPEKDVLIGDGRIGLKHSNDGYYGLIVIDVFSSDSIPMHILTREAVAMYAAKLRRGGLIAINVSNRHIDLVPVLAAIAQDTGMAGMRKFSTPSTEMELDYPAEWVVLAQTPASLTRLSVTGTNWKKLPPGDARFLWRDDYSNIWRSIDL